MPRWRIFRQFSLRFRERLLSVSLRGPSWARGSRYTLFTQPCTIPGRPENEIVRHVNLVPRAFTGLPSRSLIFCYLPERDARTSQGSQSPASIIIVVLTIHLGEERQCDPDLSFLFDASNTMVTTVERSVACSRLRDSRVRWIEKAQGKRSGTSR